MAAGKTNLVNILKGQYRFFSLRLKSAVLRVIDWKNRKDHDLPVPPPLLRYRVHGRLKMDGYLEVGEKCAADIKKLVGSTGKDLYNFSHILDFGCGNGRVIRFFRDKPESCHLYGTDIDSESINWCRKHLPFAEWGVNNYMPPMVYADNSFDCIYAISVFTHIDEQMQFAWLKELHRIASPGAVLVLTVHGASTFSVLSAEAREQLERTGFHFHVGQTGFFKHDGLPDFYQTTYHTRRYINEQWSKFFELINYVEKGINDHQDVVILRKA